MQSLEEDDVAMPLRGSRREERKEPSESRTLSPSVAPMSPVVLRVAPEVQDEEGPDGASSDRVVAPKGQSSVGPSRTRRVEIACSAGITARAGLGADAGAGVR